MKIAAFAFAALLTGCAVNQPAPAPIDNLTPKLALLPGVDVHVLIERWGYPAEQRVIAGDLVYTWVTDVTTPMPVPAMSVMSGSAGGQPFNAMAIEQQTVNVRFLCKVEVATDGRALITRTHVEGNIASCYRYGESLTR